MSIFPYCIYQERRWAGRRAGSGSCSGERWRQGAGRREPDPVCTAASRQQSRALTVPRPCLSLFSEGASWVTQKEYRWGSHYLGTGPRNKLGRSAMKHCKFTHLLYKANKLFFSHWGKKKVYLYMTLCLQEELFNLLQAFTSIVKSLRTI